MGIYTISTGLLLLASSATALRQTRPVERSTGRFCSWPVVNTITSQIAVWKDPELVAGVFVGPSSTTGSITAGYAFTKSESITGSISATYSMWLGLSTSYGVTTARGTSLSVSVSCPANIECGVTASTKVLRVIGTQTMYLCGSDELYSAAYSCEKTAPNQCPSTAWNTTLRLEHLFVMDLPLAASKSNVDGLLAVQYNACTVGTPYAGIEPCPSS